MHFHCWHLELGILNLPTELNIFVAQLRYAKEKFAPGQKWHLQHPGFHTGPSYLAHLVVAVVPRRQLVLATSHLSLQNLGAARDCG
jgi:hypothetical protein